MNAVKEYL